MKVAPATFTPQKMSLVLICYRLGRPERHSVTGRIISMKNSNYTIGNRTRDRTIGTWRWHRPLLPPRKYLWCSSVRDWDDPRATLRPEGLRQWIIPIKPSGNGSEWNLSFLDSWSENTQRSNLMKIRPMGAAVFHAERQEDTMKLIIVFLNFAKKPKSLAGHRNKSGGPRVSRRCCRL